MTGVSLYSILYSGECSFRYQAIFTNNSPIPSYRKFFHQPANCVIKQAKKEKMKIIAKNRIDRKETRVYSLIDNVDESLSNKVNSE